MKILKVIISVNGLDASISTKEIECTETAKSYKWWGSLLSKDKILTIDSLMHNYSPNSLHYYTWCLPEDIEKANKLLIDAISDKIAVFNEQVDKLNRSFNTLLSERAVSGYLKSIQS